MKLQFKIEDKKIFLENIGYKVEKIDIMYTVKGDRYCEDETITKSLYIAYKDEIPKTDLGYNGFYNFENKYSICSVFEKELPYYFMKNMLTWFKNHYK